MRHGNRHRHRWPNVWGYAKLLPGILLEGEHCTVWQLPMLPRARQHVGLVNPVNPVTLPHACEGKPLHIGRRGGLGRWGDWGLASAGFWVPGPSPLACFGSNVKVSYTVMILLKSSIVCVFFQ